MVVDPAQFARAPSPDVPTEGIDVPEVGTSVDPASFASLTPGERVQTTGQFERGVQRGVSQTKQLFFGLADMAGSALGANSLRTFAQEGISREEGQIEQLVADVPTLADIDSGADFFDWAAAKLGEQVPLLATVIGTSGAGAAAAGIARGSLKNAIKKELTNRATARVAAQTGVGAQAARATVSRQLQDRATQQLLAQTLSPKRAAAFSAVGASVGLNTGDIQNELREAGIDSPTTAAIGGIVAGGLDAVPVVALLGRMFPGVDTVLAKGFVSDVAAAMGTTAALEGSTEAAQEMVILASRAYHDPSFNILSDENQARIVEAAAAGALVGAALGGVGQAPASAIRRGRETTVDPVNKFTDFVNSRVNLATARENAAEADDVAPIPGVRELRDAAVKQFAESVAPVLNSARERASESVAQVKEALGTVDLGIDVEGTLADVEGRVRTQLGPAIDRAVAGMHAQINTARERAATMIGPERQAFFAETFRNIQANIQEFVDTRVRPVMERNEQDFSNEVETRDFEDPDSLDESASEFDPGQPEDLTKVQIGASETVTRSVPGRDGQFASTRIKARTRGSDAVPLSRSRAEAIVDDVRSAFPELQEDAVGVEAKGDGFVVAIRDIGNAEAIFEQLRVNDGISDAQASARLSPDQTRQIRVKKPGARAFTRMDVPTLALAGVDIVENSGTALPENASRRMVRGLDTMLGRLLDQGFEIEGGVAALGTRKLVGDVTVRQARGRAQFLAPEQDAEPDTGPAFDVGTDTEQLGRQANVTETEAGLAQQSRRAPNRVRNPRTADAEQWFRNSRKKLRVSLGAVDEQQAGHIADLTTELLSVAALSNRVFVVDGIGAQALADAGHPLADHLTKAQQDDPAGRLITFGDDVVVYLSGEKTLVDTKDGSVDRANAKTARVLAHEIGHLAERVYFRRLPQELRDDIYAEFKASGFEVPGQTNQGRVFEEWMAEQFVAWASRTETPSNAIEQFFRQVGTVLKNMFDWLRGQAPNLAPSFAKYMDGVAEAAKGRDSSANPFTQFFRNEGVTGYSYFSIPSEQNFDINDLQDTSRSVLDRIRKKLDNYPGLKQAAVRTWDTTLWLHDQLTASLNGALRSPGIPAMDQLADTLNRTPGEERANPTYFNATQLNRGIFDKQVVDALQNATEEQRTAAIEELISGDPQSELAVNIASTLQNIYDYMTDAGLPVRRIENYFPRVWDVEKIREPKNFEEVIKHLENEHGLSREDAERVVGNMTQSGEETASQLNLDDPLNDVPFEGFLEKRAALFDDPFFQQFQSRDLERTLIRYMSAAVKRAEFNRFYGEDSRASEGEWNPRAKLEEMIDAAREQGATEEQLQFMVKALDAALGRHGREIPDNARQTMAWVTTYQNVRLLLFSTLASFPDIVGPAIRSNDFKSTFRSLRDAWSGLVDKESDLHEMGRTWGIISDTLQQHVLTEHFDNHWFPEKARTINEKFFRAVGLERWTNFTRAAALAVGRDAIKRWANDGNTEMLAELGLTAETVRTWIADGERTHGAGDFSTSSEADIAVANAMVQFVNESIMRPNPSQRPLWASNPAFMLLFHLKSFMYSFHDTVGRRIYHNFATAETPWQKAMVAGMPALMLLALTGVGWELRELLQYRLWGRKGRTDRMDGTEYVWELAQRSGIFGVSQLAMDWEGADDRGQLGFMAISGPTISQLNELIEKPASQSVPKAIPVIGQIPPARQIVRDVTPL